MEDESSSGMILLLGDLFFSALFFFLLYKPHRGTFWMQNDYKIMGTGVHALAGIQKNGINVV